MEFLNVIRKRNAVRQFNSKRIEQKIGWNVLNKKY